MKKVLFAVSLSMLPGTFNLMAQNWVTSGNALTANGTLGTTTNLSVVFKSNNSERGRLTNSGLWGFGTTAPTSKVHISSPSGQVPLRVEENGFTQLLVNNGVTIGSNSTTPPASGLYVKGNTGIGTSAPENKLHVFSGSAGNVTGHVNAPLIIENSTDAYINILTPEASESGILFGSPASNLSGGIVYNNSASRNGLQFRTNGNKTGMILSDKGNLGIGADPGRYKLRVKHGSGSEGGISIESINFPDTDNWEIYNGGDLLLSWRSKFVGSFNSFTGAYTSISDERLKTNIKPMGAVLEKIRQLKPSSYQFKNATGSQEYNGFIAQDVMKIFPAMVTHNAYPEREIDVYTMDYSGFGVLAIKGIQELQPIIEEQKKKIATLEDRLAKLEAAFETNAVSKNGKIAKVITNASLEQNHPNPFNKNTVIRYSIPPGSKGQINIYDQTGKIVTTFIANESGRCEVSRSLPAGTYTYTLMINGEVVLSRQMLMIK